MFLKRSEEKKPLVSVNNKEKRPGTKTKNEVTLPQNIFKHIIDLAMQYVIRDEKNFELAINLRKTTKEFQETVEQNFDKNYSSYDYSRYLDKGYVVLKYELMSKKINTQKINTLIIMKALKRYHQEKRQIYRMKDNLNKINYESCVVKNCVPTTGTIVGATLGTACTIGITIWAPMHTAIGSCLWISTSSLPFACGAVGALVGTLGLEQCKKNNSDKQAEVERMEKEITPPVPLKMENEIISSFPRQMEDESVLPFSLR